MNPPDRTAVISLGAGVQSSALLLMAAAGEFDTLPAVAVFADTGWEPAYVYEWLDTLEREVAGRIEVVRCSAGNIRDDLMSFAGGGGQRYASPPVYLRGEVSAEGMLRRQCTREYKVDVIKRALRDRGYGPSRPVTQWLGITLDEVERMRPSRTQWTESRWPLIERSMTRAGCIQWLADHGYPIPGKSACIGCPYHSDATWRTMRNERPHDWADAVEVDAAIRTMPKLEGQAFLHRQRVPLPMVDLSTPEDRGQQSFADECEGLCGV